MKPIRDYRTEHLEYEREHSEDRTTHLHVTDLSSCPVGVWLKKQNKVEPELNESRYRRFDVGHAIEDRVVEAIRHAGDLIDTQGKVEYPDFNLVGSYDVLMKREGKPHLLEVKSIHNYAINHLLKRNRPHAHYEQQVQLYLNYLRKEYGDINASIYYEALDGRTAEFPIYFDEDIVKQGLSQAEELHHALETNEPPPLLDEIVKEQGKWKLNWKVKYCIQNGIHRECVKVHGKKPLHTDKDKWVNKLKYQAKKQN